MATITEDAANADQDCGPLLVVQEDLRDVAGHRHRIDDHRRVHRRIAHQPGDSVCAWLRASHGERCKCRVQSDHRDASSRKPAGEHTGAASDVQHAARAELVDDGLVVVQVGPVTVDVVVDRGESRVGEDLVRHAANDTRTPARP